MEPTTGYALVGGQRVAYQVLGEGPNDLVVVPSWFSAFDIEWEQPKIRLFYERLASFCRVIRLDRRGSGASDALRLEALPEWETFAEDMDCVMDAVDSEKAFVYADGDGGPVGLLFAATRQERVRGLILFATSARFLYDDDYPIGWPPEVMEEISDEFLRDWGGGEGFEMFVPSKEGDPDFQRWIGRLMRAVTTPSAVRSYIEGVATADARPVLASLNLPTVIMHGTEHELPPIEHGRYLADRIPSARFVELEGPGDTYPYFALGDQVMGEIERMVLGDRGLLRTERMLATVVFTDIVDSTVRAREVGDAQWRRMLDMHDEAVKRALSENGGHLVKGTGDGILATFDGPGRAIRFADRIRSDLRRIGLSIRTGIHAGEVEQRSADIGGIAVHLAARIMATAEPGQILASRTVKDLTIGSAVTFESVGSRALKGIEGEWDLFAVTGS